MREDALDALHRKRGQSDGAALFSILPRRRNRSFIRVLIAYQVTWDYLDDVSERGAHAGTNNGRRLHRALIDALAPDATARDYYRHNTWTGDGGYLLALVQACRASCTCLPSYKSVRTLVCRDALRAQVLAYNHDPEPLQRDDALRAWVASEFPSGHDAVWYELTGAASAGLAAFALLALACDPDLHDSEIARTHAAYFPWVSAVACMLDSYADRAEDAASGDHSYIGHYPSPAIAVARTVWLVSRCLDELHALPERESHKLIACSMVALYLTKDVCREDASRCTSDQIARAGGSLTRALHPMMRLWRRVHLLDTS